MLVHVGVYVAIFYYKDKLVPFIWPITRGEASTDHCQQSWRLAKIWKSLKNIQNGQLLVAVPEGFGDAPSVTPLLVVDMSTCLFL